MMCYVPREVQMPWKVTRVFPEFVVVETLVALFSVRCFVLIVQYRDFDAFSMVHWLAVLFYSHENKTEQSLVASQVNQGLLLRCLSSQFISIFHNILHGRCDHLFFTLFLFHDMIAA